MSSAMIGVIVVAFAVVWLFYKLQQLQKEVETKNTQALNYEIVDIAIRVVDGTYHFKGKGKIKTILYTNKNQFVEIRDEIDNNKAIVKAYDAEYFDLRAKDCSLTPINLTMVVFYA